MYKKKRKNKMLRMAAVLFGLVLTTTYLMSDMMARYVTSTGAADDARTAAFVFHVKDDADTFEVDLSGLTHPGTSKEYTFYVSNKDSIVSEVTQSVSAAITPDGELPFQIHLTADGKELINIDMAESKARQEKADFCTFDASQEESMPLTLKVEWPEERNSMEFSGKKASVEISLTAEQID